MSVNDSKTSLYKNGHHTSLSASSHLQWKTEMSFPFHSEYYPVVTIPAGARSIEVQELQMSSSYLAVRSLHQKYYLTGGWSVDWPGEFVFAGTVFEYQRTFNRPERLYAPGPTNETLVFEVSSFCSLSSQCLLLSL